MYHGYNGYQNYHGNIPQYSIHNDNIRNIHHINMIIFHKIPEYYHSIFINIPYPFYSHVPMISPGEHPSEA